jgi:hypothetical protein
MRALTVLVILCRSGILQTHCQSRQNFDTPTISPYICPKMVPQMLLYPHRHHRLLFVDSLGLINLAVPSTQRCLGQVYPANLHQPEQELARECWVFHRHGYSDIDVTDATYMDKSTPRHAQTSTHNGSYHGWRCVSKIRSQTSTR